MLNILQTGALIPQSARRPPHLFICPASGLNCDRYIFSYIFFSSKACLPTPSFQSLGRGADLLSCGDVESNPGPPIPTLASPTDTPSDEPMPDSSQSIPMSQDGPILPVASPPLPSLSLPSQDLPALPPLPFPLLIPTLLPSDLPSPVDPGPPATNLAISSFTCPFNCGHSPWASRPPLFQHISRVHLQSLESWDELNPWLLSAGRWVCPSCKILVCKDKACHKCRREAASDRNVRQRVPLQPPEVLDWDDSIWFAIISKPLPVIRFIPSPLQGQWAAVLSSEINLVLTNPTQEGVARLTAFCRICLAPFGRGGRRHCRQMSSIFSGRLARWQAGQFQSLAAEYLSQRLSKEQSSPSATFPDTSELSDSVRRAALRAIRDGALSKAARILSETAYSLPVNCEEALRQLHPSASPPTVSVTDAPVGDDFSVDEVLDALKTFAPGSTGGFSGLMASHLSGDHGPEHLQLLQSIANLCSAFSWGRLPQEANSLLASARLIPIGKKDGGVRPIAVGEVFRRIAGKILVARYQSDLALRLQPTQLGVGYRGGSEAIIHRLRDWLSSANPDDALLQLDFRNAFNSISRQKMLAAIKAACPFFYRYAVSCYAASATLFAEGFQVDSEEGEHQGDPCAPAFFSITIQPLVDFCNEPASQWSLWYLDDGHLVGPRAQLSSFLPLLEAKAAELGLVLNRSKCSALFIDPPAVDFFPGVPSLLPSSALRVLGSPIGDVQACQDWVAHNIISPLQKALNRLECLADPHSASLVLRQCLSGIKVNFLLRTADPATAKWTATQVSPMLRTTWGVLLGSPVSDAQWELACLPIRFGGAGIQDPLHFWDAANISSWMTAFAGPARLAPRQPPPAFIDCVHSLCLRAPHLASPLHASLCCPTGPGFALMPCSLNGRTRVHGQMSLTPSWPSSGIHMHRSVFNAFASSILPPMRVFG